MSPSPAAFPDDFNFRAHDAFVRRLAFGLLRDAEDVNDAAQDVWVAALRHGPRSAGDLRNWLAHVTKNVSIQLLRSRAARARREELLTYESADADVHEVVSREETRRRIFDAAVALDEPYRTVILLRYFSDLPPREIARRLGAPVETVKTRLKRGIEQMRARLAGERGGAHQAAWAVAGVALFNTKQTFTISAGALGLMATKTKAAIVAAIIVLLSIGIWLAVHEYFYSNSNGETIHSPNAADVAAVTTNTPASLPTASAPETPASRAPVESPPASAPAQLYYGSMLVHVRWHDATPAAGVGIGWIPWSTHPDAGPHIAHFITDTNGDFRAARAPVGGVFIQIDRWHGVDLDIKPGEESEITLTLPEGFSVEGRVVTASGSPVADAEIHLHNTNEGIDWIGARSNNSGEFKIRSIEDWSWMYATAPAYAASKGESVSGAKGAVVNITLTLSDPGGTVAGRVLDTHNQPVAEASAWIGTFNWHVPNPGRVPRPPLHVITDSDGKFIAHSVPLGKTPVYVRAAPLAPSKSNITVSGDTPATLDIVLQPGVSLVGTFLDNNGVSIKNGTITINRRGIPDYYEAIVRPNGTFRIDGLPPEEITVEADARDQGRAMTTLRGAPGEELRWDVNPVAGQTLSGRVVDDRGNAITNCYIEAYIQTPDPKNPLRGGSAHNDENGRFEIPGCPNAGLRVTVGSRSNQRWPLVKLENVHADAGELVITIKSAELSKIMGFVADAEGNPVRSGSVVCRALPRGGSAPASVDPKSGAFEMASVPPGKYYLEVTVTGLGRGVSAVHDLAPGETWDAGTIIIQKPGTLAVDVRYEGGIVKFPRCLLQVVDVERFIYSSEIPVKDERLLPTTHPPGKYVLLLRAPLGDCACAAHSFEIRSGEETRVDLRIRPGNLQKLHFKLPASAAASREKESLRLIIKDETGARIFEEPSIAAQETDDFTEMAAFAPGTYQFEASTTGGLTASGKFTVETGPSSNDWKTAPKIDVELHP
ncbi:MAG: sigma-70 family RNA polymerase sigma factor [Planctomycetes bacterium]|nr:sigma-70 family RNA polymerase sigma factor [Planctomycetota bacterium]